MEELCCVFVEEPLKLLVQELAIADMHKIAVPCCCLAPSPLTTPMMYMKLIKNLQREQAIFSRLRFNYVYISCDARGSHSMAVRVTAF